MAPGDSARPTVSEAERSADRSGRLAASIGVGTGDDEEIGGAELGRIVGQLQPGGLQSSRVDLMRAVDAAAQLADAACVHVEANNRCTGAGEGHRHRQADVAEADHGDAAAMHDRPRVSRRKIPGCAK